MSIKRGESQKIFETLKKFKLVDCYDSFIAESETPIINVLNNSIVHITLYSSVTIEASSVNVPTILLDPEIQKDGSREDFFKQEINAGNAFYTNVENFESLFFDLVTRKNSFISPAKDLAPKFKKIFNEITNKIKYG